MIKVGEDNSEVQHGKQLVEQYLREKGAADFEWGKHFDPRNYWVRFNWEGSQYKTLTSHSFLTNLKTDSQKSAKLKAFWESKSRQDN